MRVLLDSSFIISFFLQEKHTEKTERVFKDIFEGATKGFVTEIIIAEVCGATARRAGKDISKKILSFLDEWISNGLLTLIPQSPDISRNAYQWCILFRIKGADALIASSARAAQCHLATHDQEIIQKLSSVLPFI